MHQTIISSEYNCIYTYIHMFIEISNISQHIEIRIFLKHHRFTTEVHAHRVGPWGPDDRGLGGHGLPDRREDHRHQRPLFLENGWDRGDKEKSDFWRKCWRFGGEPNFLVAVQYVSWFCFGRTFVEILHFGLNWEDWMTNWYCTL